jgi:hypothetical protein
MNFRTTYVLFGLLLALFVVVGVVLFFSPSKGGKSGLLFPSLAAPETKAETKDFTRVAIKPMGPDDGEAVLEKGEDDVWRFTEPRPLAADATNVGQLLQELLKTAAQPGKTPPSRKDAGLDDPTRVVTFTVDGRELKLTIGAVTPLEGSGLVFAESSERPGEVLVVSKADVRTALEGLAFFRDKSLLGDTADVKRVRLTMGKKTPVELKKEGGAWEYVQPAYGEADATALITALNGLTVFYTDEKTNDFVKDQVPAGELAKYNLDPAKGDVLRIEVTKGNGKKASAVIGVKKKDGDKYFAAPEGTGTTRDVVKVSATSVEPLEKLMDDPGSLRNRNLVKLDGPPDAIDIQNSYGLLEFRKAGVPGFWELYRGGPAIKVDATAAQLLVSALTQRELKANFADMKRRKELGLGEKDQVIVIKVYSDSLEKPEPGKKGKPAFKKDAKPAAILRLGNVEDGNVAVERIWGKQHDILLVPEGLKELAKKGPREYIDKRVPPYSDSPLGADVTKLEIKRPGGDVELALDKDGETWKFVKPYKGRSASKNAVQGILSALNSIRAQSVEAEKVEPKEMDSKYGTGKLRATVTVKSDGKETKHTFDFGKAKGAGSVFMKTSDSPLLFVVPSSEAKALEAELRDRTVLAFDVDKVTGITIRGWADKGKGKPLTFSAERDGDNWKIKEPSGNELKEQELKDFLQALSNVQAEKFLASGSKFDPKDGGLEVKLTLKDKKVLTLNVGAEVGGSYAVKSSQATGDVFAVAKGMFEKIRKDGRNYFYN